MSVPYEPLIWFAILVCTMKYSADVKDQRSTGSLQLPNACDRIEECDDSPYNVTDTKPVGSIFVWLVHFLGLFTNQKLNKWKKQSKSCSTASKEAKQCNGMILWERIMPLSEMMVFAGTEWRARTILSSRQDRPATLWVYRLLIFDLCPSTHWSLIFQEQCSSFRSSVDSLTSTEGSRSCSSLSSPGWSLILEIWSLIFAKTNR